MSHKISLTAVFALLTLGLSVIIVDARGSKAPAALPGTAFTYQGQLKNNGALVNGACDFQFGLWDASTLGAQVGTTQTVSALSVTNGLFMVQLNDSGQITGGTAFNGDARYLAEAVRCPSGGGSYTGLAPRQALTPAPMAFALPGLYTQQNATSPNIIGGYSGNVISPTLVGATISGGGANGFSNRAQGNYATIGGGTGNTASGSYAAIGGGHANTATSVAAIGGGWGNAASGPYSTIGGGYGNASGPYSTIGGGAGNAASGSYAAIGGGFGNAASGNRAAIGGGESNTASGDYASVPGGSLADASHYGEMAYANGSFAVNGDAQTSMYVLRRSTSNSTATELFLNGNTASQRLTVAAGRTLVFDILVAGRRDSNGDSAGYRFVGVIENVGGTTAIIGSVVKTVMAEDDVTWDAAVSADNTNDSLKITVTGPSGTVRWVAVARTVEVAN